MTATAAPFGFVAARHPTGEARMSRYTIAPGYATALFKGMPVILDTNGTITAGVANADLLGVFAGVEYRTASGLPIVNTTWPAGGVPGGTEIYAWVYDDPDVEYLVQATGPVAQTALGDQADVANVGSNANGQSTCALNATLATVGLQGQFRITGFDLGVDNAPGDAFTKVMVKIARHQFRANKTAI